MRGLCLLGQRAMTLCRGALGLSDPTWYPMPRDGQSQAVSSGELASIARRGATPGGLVAIGVSVSGEEGSFLLSLYSQPASQHGIGTALPHALRAAKTGNHFRGLGCSFLSL
ncbi:hypothetical protein EDB85DRAFT_2054805, partial [Lactarius pseudohatsudake]